MIFIRNISSDGLGWHAGYPTLTLLQIQKHNTAANEDNDYSTNPEQQHV